MKIVTVPLTSAAIHRLNLDQALPTELKEIHLSEEEFDGIWRIGLFDRINAELGTLIDDYEDDSIVGLDRLVLLSKITEPLSEKSAVVGKIHNLVLLAIDRKTGIFFHF